MAGPIRIRSKAFALQIHVANIVYRRIAPGLLKSLKQRRNEMGRPNEKLHSSLSLDVGVPAIRLHLGTVVGHMKLNVGYEKFEKQLDEIAPTYPEHPGLFDDPKDWEPRDLGDTIA